MLEQREHGTRGTISFPTTGIARLLAFSLLLLSSWPLGCGGSGKRSSPSSGKGSSPAQVSLSGGNSDASGSGGNGGTLTVRALRGFSTSTGTIPAAPPAGTVIADLSADVVTHRGVTVSR